MIFLLLSPVAKGGRAMQKEGLPIRSPQLYFLMPVKTTQMQGFSVAP